MRRLCHQTALERKIMNTHKLRDFLPSAAMCFAIAVLAVAGALYLRHRQQKNEWQVWTSPETETDILLATENTAAPTTAAEPEYITVSCFVAYDFIPLSDDLQVSIYTACAKYEIAYDLILAMIKTESEFDTAAIGDSGHAYGLMQIQPRWWDWLATEKGLPDYRTDAAQNAELGIAILSFLLTENGGDLNKALIAYNGGADYPAKVYANYDWIYDNEKTQ